MTTRRTFLKTSAAIGGALALDPLAVLSATATPAPERAKRDVGKAPASLNILILGGTGFTGPEQVEYAIARGHRVTLFNRGKTRPGVFKGKVAEELIGDLNSDTSALAGKKFDVVIDNPTTLPFWVKNAAKYLAGNTKHYIFISTTSVYADESQIGINENSPTVPMPSDLDPYKPDQRNDSTRDALRRVQGTRGAEVQIAVSGHRHHHSAVPHRRPPRSHRPLHVLAGAHRSRRGSARAGQAGRSVSVHRLARLGRVDDSHGGSARVRDVQRDRAGEAARPSARCSTA